jgi:hypothetical protein
MMFLLGIKSFIQAYWKILLPILIVWIVYFMFVSLENERDNAVKDLNDMKALMAQQVADNQLKLAKAKNDQVASETEAHQQIKDLNIDKNVLTKTIKDYYAPNHTQPVMVHPTSQLLPRPASSGATETTASSEGLTESERECRSASAGLQAKIETLEDALATETVDFNRARARVDRDCVQLGCLVE